MYIINNPYFHSQLDYMQFLIPPYLIPVKWHFESGLFEWKSAY